MLSLTLFASLHISRQAGAEGVSFKSISRGPQPSGTQYWSNQEEWKTDSEQNSPHTSARSSPHGSPRNSPVPPRHASRPSLVDVRKESGSLLPQRRAQRPVPLDVPETGDDEDDEPTRISSDGTHITERVFVETYGEWLLA
jgi:hypothetical protein